MTAERVEIIEYISEIDGVRVVEIDTFAADVPAIRVYLNDAPIWDQGPVTP